MNQQPPTREEFEKLQEQVNRIEQQTEPINVRIERGLPIPEAHVLQTTMDMVARQGPDIAQLKVHMERAEADIKAIRESQADFRDRLQTTATKEDLNALEARTNVHINGVEARIEARLDRLEAELLRRLPKPEGE